MHQEGQVANNFEIVVNKEWEKETNVWSSSFQSLNWADALKSWGCQVVEYNTDVLQT